MEWTEKEFRKIYMELSKKLLEFYSPAWVAAGRPVAAYSPDFVRGWTSGRKGFRVGLPGDATNLSSPLEQWCLDLAYTSRHSITMADGDILVRGSLRGLYEIPERNRNPRSPEPFRPGKEASTAKCRIRLDKDKNPPLDERDPPGHN